MHNKTKAAPTAAKTTATSLYLFSARKPGLWSYDINGTNPPTLIGSAPDAFNFCAITTAGATLYLLNQGITEQSNTALWTLEAGADTVMPVQSATPPGVTFNGITAVGNTVYLTRYDAELVATIYSYEIGSLQGPTLIQSTQRLQDSFTAIGVYDNRTLYLIAYNSDGGIWLFDFVSKIEPRRIPSTKGLGFNGAVRAGNYIYLTAQGNGGLWKFDILTGDTPVQIASTQGMSFFGLTLIGNTVYLGTADVSGIWQFDLTTMGVPVNIPATKGFGLPLYG